MHNCKNKKCKHNYVGETARRKVKIVEEHAGKDKKSHIFQHSRSTKHPRAKYENFEILATKEKEKEVSRSNVHQGLKAYAE